MSLSFSYLSSHFLQLLTDPVHALDLDFFYFFCYLLFHRRGLQQRGLMRFPQVWIGCFANNHVGEYGDPFEAGVPPSPPPPTHTLALTDAHPCTFIIGH